MQACGLLDSGFRRNDTQGRLSIYSDPIDAAPYVSSCHAFPRHYIPVVIRNRAVADVPVQFGGHNTYLLFEILKIQASTKT